MSTIKLFNKAFTGSTTDYKELSKTAYKIGYLIHPDCSTIEVLSFLQSQTIDYGSTFYKSFDTVISMSRWELFLDQIIHYASTYGTNFKSEAYIPEGTADIPAFTTFKVIMPITRDEAVTRCKAMLSSGIALSQKTIEEILAVLRECDYILDINIVKNKEAKMWLYKATDTVPKDNLEMVRYLVFLATKKSLLIKDKTTINSIKEAKLDISHIIDKFGIDNLSSVFYRYKLIFLAFKKANPVIINKLRRLAVKNHTPIKVGFWENILVKPDSLGQLSDKLLEINNFKKITLIEAINVKLSECKINTYNIRSGKVWLDEEPRKETDKNYLNLLKIVIYSSLIDSLKLKATTIQLPVSINLTLPKSEKSFIGNFPLGSTIDLSSSDTIVGINWKLVDGANDLDLKLIDLKGK